MRRYDNSPTRSRTRKEGARQKNKNTVLSKRNYGYLVGIAILPAATLGYLIGFVSPYWHYRRNTSAGITKVHGLWLVCEEVNERLMACEQTIFRADDWLRGMQFLEVMGLVFLLLSCLFAVLLNCTHKGGHSRLLELVSGAASVFAIFGSLGYLFLTMSPRDTADELTYNWAFGVNLTGSILAVLAAILIATNNPVPSDPKEDRTALWVNGSDAAPQPHRVSPGALVPYRPGVPVQGQLVPVAVGSPSPKMVRAAQPLPAIRAAQPVLRMSDPRRNGQALMVYPVQNYI